MMPHAVETPFAMTRFFLAQAGGYFVYICETTPDFIGLLRLA
jgi:hypothetical protein